MNEAKEKKEKRLIVPCIYIYTDLYTKYIYRCIKEQIVMID